MECTIKDFLDYFKEQPYPNLFSRECLDRIPNIETAFGHVPAKVTCFETVISSADRCADFSLLEGSTDSHQCPKYYELDYESYRTADIKARIVIDVLTPSVRKDNPHFYQTVLSDIAGKERTERLLPMLQHCIQILSTYGHYIRYIGAMNARGENNSIRLVSDDLPRGQLISLLRELHWNGNLEKLDRVLAGFDIIDTDQIFALDFDIFEDHISDKIGFCSSPRHNSIKRLQEYISFLEQNGLCLPEKGQDIIRWAQACPSHTHHISNDVAYFKFPFIGDRITKAKVYLRQTTYFDGNFFQRYSTPEFLNLCISSGNIFPDKNRSLYWVTEAAAEGIRTVHLYGTDVLHCPYLMELVSACKLHSLEVTVPVHSETAAENQDIQKLLSRLTGCGLTGIFITIEGRISDSQDSFKQILTAAREAHCRYIGIKWVIQQKNAEDLTAVLKLAEQSGVQSLTICGWNPDTVPCPVHLTRQQMISAADSILAYSGPVQAEIDPCFSALKAIAGKRAFLNVNAGILKGCRAGRDSITVNSQGRLVPCRYLDYPENFLSIKEYWNNSAVLAQIRNAAGTPQFPCSSCPYNQNCIPCFALHTESADCISMADDTCPLKTEMPAEDRLILTDINDNQIGTETKLTVHRKGLLHRAFSVFIYSGSTVLIQKRAAGKYHSAGLWANTCCSHPRNGETTADAAKRRLMEEAGIACNLHEVQSFIYRAPFKNGLTEYEIDHIFAGEYSGTFTCNREEAEDMKFIDMDELSQDIVRKPERYAPWFITAYPLFLRSIRQ